MMREQRLCEVKKRGKLRKKKVYEGGRVSGEMMEEKETKTRGRSSERPRERANERKKVRGRK